jgi:hypothetical protein
MENTGATENPIAPIAAPTDLITSTQEPEPSAQPSEVEPALKNVEPETSSPVRKTSSQHSRFSFILTILGLLSLSYLSGAAVMFFQFPSSGFLSKGFMGTRAWAEKRIASAQTAPELPSLASHNLDRPDKTFDGYTLYASASLSSLVPNTQVFLIDMKREVVHHWIVSFSKIWPNPPHLQGRQVDDFSVCIFACHPYENGDLLVVFHSLEFTVHGYGLAKIDKDSNLIWSYPASVHHDVVVGEDGTIYTLVQRPVYSSHKGLEYVPLPWLVDYLVMLSPDGKEVRPPISILEALRNSPYSMLLSPLETSLNPSSTPELSDESLRELRQRQDVLHANSVSVLSSAQAAKFPNFKPGQILVSIRNLHTLAVIDPTTETAVWGACGPWHYQHDAQFLDNGHVMLFDNIGSPRGSRVIEYDTQQSSFPWSYPGIDNPPFFSRERGLTQRLPNGNTLIVNSDGKEMFEVSPAKEIVWSCDAPGFITTARRYPADRFSFLKPGQKPRS